MAAFRRLRSSNASRALPWLAVLAVLLVMSQPARASRDEVLVRLLSREAPDHVALSTYSGGHLRVGTETLVWPAGARVVLRACGRGVEVAPDGTSSRFAQTVTLQADDVRLSGRRLAGALTVRSPDGRSLFVVAAVTLEDYVGGVVSAEALADAPREALRAQAVAARAYAVALAHPGRALNRPCGPHGDEGYDFCDLTHCQVFRGLGSEMAVEAARSTRGLRLRRNGRDVAAWYHSTCGGRTVSGAEVGGDPALQSVSDIGPDGRAWCAASPHFRWRVDLSASDIGRAVELSPPSMVRVLSRTAADRAREVEIVAHERRVMGGIAFWQALGRALGWGLVESPWFRIRTGAGGFHFEGRGLGHGAGLCQFGSMAMARAGRGFRQIIAHYYPGTRLQ